MMDRPPVGAWVAPFGRTLGAGRRRLGGNEHDQEGENDDGGQHERKDNDSTINPDRFGQASGCRGRSVAQLLQTGGNAHRQIRGIVAPAAVEGVGEVGQFGPQSGDLRDQVGIGAAHFDIPGFELRA